MAEEKKAEKEEQLARGVVARGHTVRVPHPTETTIVGINQETGKPIRAPKVTDYGPGQEVTLPRSELKRLRELGHIVDPEKIAGDEPSEGSHLSETAA